jgi:hypothetical protein
MTAPETGEWYDSGTTLSFTGWSSLVLSVPLQKWEPRRPDHPNQALTMTHTESSRMNRQKAVPILVRTKSRTIARRAQTDRSMRDS